jgi:hypothetical protein
MARPFRKALTIGAIALALVLLLTPVSLAAQDATPAAVIEVTTTTKGSASETRYPTNADQLLTVDGVPSGWTPVSVRYYDAEDGLFVYIELRNDSGVDQLTPRLYADLSLEGVSYGQDEVWSVNAWTPAGESAYFQSLSFFGGSLSLGDWDAETWYVTNDTYNDPAIQDTSRVLVKDGRVANKTDAVVGTINFATIVRDGEGVFVGSCLDTSTGANIPPGKSVRVRNLHQPGDRTPTCGFTSNGMASSGDLEISGDFMTTTIISAISEP